MFGLIPLLACVLGIEALAVPAISPCKRNDDACLTKLTRAMYDLTVIGNPELGIESSDPILRDEIIGNLGIVNYKLSNNTLIGYSRCKVQNSIFHFSKSRAEIELTCPELYMDGAYEIEGELLGLPIKGKGPYWLRCKAYLVKLDTEIEKVMGSDNKLHLAFKNFKLDADLQEGMDFQLDNLFDGNKELADPLLKFMRQNWKAAATLLQGPAFNANLKIVFKNVNKYLKQIPLENMIVD